MRRPNAAPKSRSKLRTSFAPDEADEETDNTPTVVKSKPRLGQSSSTQSLPRFNIDGRKVDQDDALRPSYSKSALEELRNSTPSTPKDLSIYDPSSGAEDIPSNSVLDLDIASKFGAPTATNSSSIPSASEIAEKKSRRARRAKEQAAADFIPLEDDNELYDSDGEFKPRRMQVGTYLHKTSLNEDEVDTRLVRDDEDILEGFDEFTEDNNGASRITMGRKQLLQAQRRDREAMRHLIDHAEGSSGTSESDSETERNHAYEAAQTSHGMEGLSVSAKTRHRKAANRPRQPREITPVPKLNVALERLRERIQKIEMERVKIERRREEIRKERAEIKASQEHIQRSLTEAGEELERVQRKQAEEEETRRTINGDQAQGGGRAGNTTVATHRGLDSMGLAPEPT